MQNSPKSVLEDAWESHARGVSLEVVHYETAGEGCWLLPAAHDTLGKGEAARAAAGCQE